MNKNKMYKEFVVGFQIGIEYSLIPDESRCLALENLLTISTGHLLFDRATAKLRKLSKKKK